jgi:hypothetical protein
MEQKTITTKRSRITTDQCQRPMSARTIVRKDVEAKTAFDVFGSELPDEAFAGVFDQPRQTNKPLNC